MMPIFWQRALVRPVQDWDSLSFSDCERLVRGLYLRVGMVPADAGPEKPVAHAGGELKAWSGAAMGAMRQKAGASIMPG